MFNARINVVKEKKLDLSVIAGPFFSAEEEDSVLVFEDILPEPPKQYDRMAPPKTKGNTRQQIIYWCL